jgi:hypothetical protein
MARVLTIGTLPPPRPHFSCFGLAVPPLGGLAAFFAHPALIALAIARCVQSGVADLLIRSSARPRRDGRRPLVILLRDGRHFSRHPPDRVGRDSPTRFATQHKIRKSS